MYGSVATAAGTQAHSDSSITNEPSVVAGPFVSGPIVYGQALTRAREEARRLGSTSPLWQEKIGQQAGFDQPFAATQCFYVCDNLHRESP